MGGQTSLHSHGVHTAPGTELVAGLGIAERWRCWFSGSQLTPGLYAQALLHLLLLYGLVVSTALIWHPINKLAALLLLPYLAWLTVTSALTYHLWRDSLCPVHQPQPTEKSD